MIALVVQAVGWIGKFITARRDARRADAEIANLEAAAEMSQAAAALSLAKGASRNSDTALALLQEIRGLYQAALERIAQLEEQLAAVTAECAERAAADSERIDELARQVADLNDRVPTDDLALRPSRTPVVG